MFSKQLRALASVAALCFFISSLAAPGQPAPAQKTRLLTIDEVIRMSLTNNLDILISQLNPVIDQFTVNGLYGVYQPNLTMNAVHTYNSFPPGILTAEAGLHYGGSVESVNTYTPGLSGALPTGLTYTFTGPLSRQSVTRSPVQYSSDPGVSLTQPLLKNLWIDNYRYQILVSKQNLKIDQMGLRLQIMTVINNIKAAYYNLIFARQNVQVEEAAVALARETMREDEQRVQVGALAPLDEKQAASQAASAESDLLTAQTTLVLQENIIKGLLALRLEEWTGVTPVPSEQLLAVPENPNVQECWRAGLEQRPDFLQAKLSVERQHITIKYDYNQLFPEIDLTGGYGRNATELTFGDNLTTIKNGNFPAYSYGVLMTIPLGNSGPRNNYKSAKAGLEQLVLQLKKVESAIIVGVDNDVKTVNADFLKVDSTRKARSYAEEALQAEQTKLQHGKSTSFVVLQLQNNLTTARSAEIRALADYNIALEQLAFDDGTTLQRNHIYLQVR
ncbi:MAG TPA: TolC family protein [Candidatus Saccharimonadales bacterium]|nr:TolC family protein [Candidatus Saccharimonadales bacterium]